MVGRPLTGKTLGIIGMGRIGKIVAERARGFGMKIIYYNRNRLSEDLEDGAKYFSDINSMMPECDFVSIHTPATAETKHILNATTISLLPKHAVVINTSRGSTIDDEALINALQNKKIYGYGVDVYENEPDLKSIFTGMNNVVMTPHIGASTKEAQEKVAKLIAEQIVDYLLHDKSWVIKFIPINPHMSTV
jgi:glyoxylate reductase